MLSQEGMRMLNDISIVDFVLVDLSLYLDTHPFDQEAMEYFNHFHGKESVNLCGVMNADCNFL